MQKIFAVFFSIFLVRSFKNIVENCTTTHFWPSYYQRLIRSDPSSHASRSERFLLQALICFQAACRFTTQTDSQYVVFICFHLLNQVLLNSCFQKVFLVTQHMKAYVGVCVSVCPRLAEDCASDPVLKENTFTAPYKQSNTQDSLESLCECVLHCCDSVWIHTVTVRATHTHTHTSDSLSSHLNLLSQL